MSWQTEVKKKKKRRRREEEEEEEYQDVKIQKLLSGTLYVFLLFCTKI
jgi:hypothetical protein